MAKQKRVIVGSIIKNKDNTKPDYIKMDKDVVLKKGQYLNLESKKLQIEKLEAAGKAGKLSEDLVEKMRANLEKIPDFVRFQIVLLEQQAE